MIKRIFLVVMITYSCTEEYIIDFSNSDQKLIIEGSITDTTYNNYVRLCLSKSTFKYYIDSAHYYPDNTYQNGLLPVLDAKIIVSDNMGNFDTLVKPPDSITKFYYDQINHKYVYYKDLNRHASFYGYYQTTKIKGTIGNTYYLRVLWKDKEYNASCYMPQVPEIDSVKYIHTAGMPGKPNYYIPYLFFKDDTSTTDFYLFKITGGQTWGRAILSDEFLKSQVTGIDVFKGESPVWWLNAYPSECSDFKIEMHAITKEIYNYYQALIAQYHYDGGVYTPSPTSPPTNISNGALGYFSASSVRVVTGKLPCK